MNEAHTLEKNQRQRHTHSYRDTHKHTRTQRERPYIGSADSSAALKAHQERRSTPQKDPLKSNVKPCRDERRPSTHEKFTHDTSSLRQSGPSCTSSITSSVITHTHARELRGTKQGERQESNEHRYSYARTPGERPPSHTSKEFNDLLRGKKTEKVKYHHTHTIYYHGILL